ncbi:MAG: DUF1501 domain-containing protein [Pirellulales bacterium]
MSSPFAWMNRRHWLQAVGASMMGASFSGWLPRIAQAAADDPRRQRQCIVLWMAGGPSQLDTFDLKPGHANGGPFKEIDTVAPGLRFSEHLPRLAKQGDRLAVLRGVSTKEGDHGRGTYLMHTGRPPQGPIRYPALGAFLGKELAETKPMGGGGIPSYVSVSPFRAFNPAAFSPGFLGPRYSPLTVGALDQPQATEGPDDKGYARLRVDDLSPPSLVSADRFQTRLAMWREMQDRFLTSRAAAGAIAQDTMYRHAIDLMSHEVVKAFDLSEESDQTRNAYGKGRFGQGCLLARRLIERGVPFVEVTLAASAENQLGWDTHTNNFPAVQQLSGELDAGWSQLMSDLADRGLLENTTIAWMGEFGRTPKINNSAGRDHFPVAWTCALAGGGIRGGTVHGATSDDGTEVKDGKVDVGDILATLCAALGLKPDKENISQEGRPIKLAEGKVIQEVL